MPTACHAWIPTWAKYPVDKTPETQSSVLHAFVSELCGSAKQVTWFSQEGANNEYKQKQQAQGPAGHFLFAVMLTLWWRQYSAFRFYS
jgi:hypothetical protein